VARRGLRARRAERDHPLATRDVRLPTPAAAAFRPVAEDRHDPASWTRSSPMAAVDAGFLATVRANPGLRPRVGNPDGAVITALNEEAVASAALGNKGGINIVVTYEAFGAKMLGGRAERRGPAAGLALGPGGADLAYLGERQERALPPGPGARRGTARGGTLSIDGMLFVNGATWAHVVDSVASLLGADRATLLTADEIAVLDHRVPFP
jgi:hypothetical protein